MRFPFRLYILRRMYRLRLPTPIARSSLVVSRNFQACKHNAFDKIMRKERPGKTDQESLKTILYGQIIKKRKRKN